MQIGVIDKVHTMPAQITPAVSRAATSPTSINELIDRAGDLKGELVAFAQGPRFARRLDARLFEAAESHGYLDEATAVRTGQVAGTSHIRTVQWIGQWGAKSCAERPRRPAS